jgi:hypothetical protein
MLRSPHRAPSGVGDPTNYRVSDPENNGYMKKENKHKLIPQSRKSGRRRRVGL